MRIWQKKITAKLFFLLFISAFSFGQSKVKVTIEIIDLKKESEQKSVSAKDSLQAVRFVSEQLYQLYFQGYLGADILTENWGDSRLRVEIFKGEQYELKNLEAGNIDSSILSAIGFKEKKNKDQPFRFDEIESIFRKILDYAENSGYPFASIKLDSLQIYDHYISASLNLWPGPQVLFDSLTVKGFSKIKSDWLANFLGIQYKQPYQEKAVRNINDKIKQLKFIVLANDPQIVFSKDKAKVILELRERKINSIDGVIGFLPNASQNSKLLLTGNLDIHLYNLFSSAKQLHLDWQRVKANSQTFDFEFRYPQFLKMPVGINLGLNLLKEDTVYFNRNFNVKLNFSPAPNQSLFVNTEWESSRLTGSQASSPVLQFSDYDINYYGVTYQVNRLNDVLVPTNGWYFSVEGLAGKKKVLNFDNIEDSVYQDADFESTQYKLKGQIENFFSFSKSYTGRINVLAGSIIGKSLFTNDFFRLGGLNTLRGFNENFFFVSDYLVANAEFRLQGSQETYFFIFYDQGVVRNKLTRLNDYPLGAGMGMSLSTKTGIFNFIFALGKSQSQNFSINSAKIHFGYTGRF